MNGTNSIYSKYIKRMLDFCLALIALIVLSWLFIIIATLVRVKLGSPVIFVQPRPGKDEKIFKLYKFRTMTDASDKDGNLFSDEERLTKFGRSLRSSSLDELPEMLNILKGDMAFIGPRPLLVQYLSIYSEAQHHRHDIRPGLTGWAQVNGRNAITWTKRFEYDLEYIRKISFAFDVKILIMTVISVISHKGISSGTSSTMEDFVGDN